MKRYWFITDKKIFGSETEGELENVTEVGKYSESYDEYATTYGEKTMAGYIVLEFDDDDYGHNIVIGCKSSDDYKEARNRICASLLQNSSAFDFRNLSVEVFEE